MSDAFLQLSAVIPSPVLPEAYGSAHAASPSPGYRVRPAMPRFSLVNLNIRVGRSEEAAKVTCFLLDAGSDASR